VLFFGIFLLFFGHFSVAPWKFFCRRPWQYIANAYIGSCLPLPI